MPAKVYALPLTEMVGTVELYAVPVGTALLMKVRVERVPLETAVAVALAGPLPTPIVTTDVGIPQMGMTTTDEGTGVTLMGKPMLLLTVAVGKLPLKTEETAVPETIGAVLFPAKVETGKAVDTALPLLVKRPARTLLTGPADAVSARHAGTSAARESMA